MPLLYFLTGLGGGGGTLGALGTLPRILSNGVGCGRGGCGGLGGWGGVGFSLDMILSSL